MANPEISTELRWFLRRPIGKEAELKNWFDNNPRWRKTPADVEKREDLYLIALKNTRISPKLRGGKLEIKFLGNPEETKEILDSDGKPVGLGQIWHKWKWSYIKNTAKGQFENKFDELVAAGFLEKTSKELRFNIAKTRAQRKFKDKNGELESVPMDDRSLPYGYLAEVTELEVNDEQWCTIAVEVFGNPDQAMMKTLQQGVNSLFRHYDGPDLKVADSYSYPEWLTRIG
jgi:hypothetical protein